MEARIITTIDKQGRIYLHEKVRRVSGLTAGALIEIIARPGEIVIRPAKSVARESQGIFRVKKDFISALRDIDSLAQKISVIRAIRELGETV